MRRSREELHVMLICIAFSFSFDLQPLVSIFLQPLHRPFFMLNERRRWIFAAALNREIG
jgi:hypothetical protein